MNETEQLKNRIEMLEKEVKTLVEVLVFVKESSAIRLNLKNEIFFATGSAIGFYGKDPAKQQTATDLATVITALKNYGLLTP